MATALALLLILGAMFGGALAVDSWRASRLRAWAQARGWSPVDRQADGGALLAHATRFSRRVRSFGLAFHQVTAEGEVWLAEHRASLPTGPAEKWHTLVVVRVPGSTLPPAAAGPEAARPLDAALPVLAGWAHGGDVDVEGEYVRWRRQGLLWPWSIETTLARGRELAALVTRRAR